MRRINTRFQFLHRRQFSGWGRAVNSGDPPPESAKEEATFMKTIALIFLVSGILILFAVSVHTGSAGEAPTTTTLDSLSDKYEPVIFDHAKHESIAGDCGTCHHQHGNFGTLPCKECHALTPSVFRNSATGSFTACRSCHGPYDPSNPGMPGLKSAYHQQCFQCHRGMGDIGKSPTGCTNMCHGRKRPSTQKS